MRRWGSSKLSFTTIVDLTSPAVAEIRRDRVFDSTCEIRYLTFMNDMPQDAWFYTCEGERIGPVLFSELQIKAQEGDLNPRLDMVWTQAMEAWKPAGEIEGLFERRTAAEAQESLAPKADPYTSPKGESAEAMMAKEGGWPGSRRRVFLFFLFIFPAVWVFLTNFAEPFMKQQFGEELMKVLPTAIMLVPGLILIYVTLNRFVNLGMSRWWFFGHLIPFVNLWVGYRCFACPGGYAFHKKLDGAGIFLAIIYWVSLAFVLAVIGVAIAMLLGLMGTPEMHQQLKEILEKASHATKP